MHLIRTHGELMDEGGFITHWHQASVTSLGLFWMAFWAFGLGYLVSSLIQVFVTKARMQKAMGRSGARSVGLATFFGFLSSSCSFSALATTRSLFSKGAGLIPSLAFLLSSTNLVIELGIVISVFLSWHFVVGEYLGAVILIGVMWLCVRLFYPEQLIEQAREHARSLDSDHDGAGKHWRDLIRTLQGWRQVSQQYFMEWQMVWKDVTIGFTVAGVIAAFVPQAFFQTLFIGSGTEDPSFWLVLSQTLIGPIAAFFTFIGSMGNIPLAAVLFGNGVSFAGVMAFIFSDLVVLPVLRVNATFYGWRMALYILGIFLICLVTAALVMHYLFAFAGWLPDPSQVTRVTDREFFAVDYTLWLNLFFAALTVAAAVLIKSASSGDAHDGHEHHHHSSSTSDRVLFVLAIAAFAWLGGGLIAGLLQ